ncbi:MAG: CsbD family protein [Planctomyces sp.]|nr:CsbD family protein [Planctomyces sp.]
MVSASEIKGNWNQLKGLIRERWGEFTDNEFLQMQGNSDQLIGVIQKKTGAARQDVEKFLNGVLKGAESTVSDALEDGRQLTSKAAEAAARIGSAAREQYGRISERVSETYDDAQELVRNQPGVSVGVAFAAGLVGGAIIGLLLRPSR